MKDHKQIILDAVQQLANQHPDLAEIMEEIAIRAQGRQDYNPDTNGEADLLKKVGRTNPEVMFDVGANVGNWSVAAHKFAPRAKIHCFELSRSTFDTLRRRLAGDCYVLNNLAMSDRSGQLEYKDYGVNSGVNTILMQATFHDHAIEPTIMEAESISGDEYCEKNGIDRIDFLKIDVEGAEHTVLAGFADLLRARRIRFVQFEYGYTNGDAGFLMRDFFELFESYAYVVGPVRKGSIAMTKWHYKLNDFTSGPNFVAVRADDTEARALLRKPID